MGTDMAFRSLGSLEVSVVGLGCNNFGGRLDEAQSRLVIEAALDAGVNFFDTADIYGGTLSEEIIGRALGRHRESVVLATKFGMHLGPEKDGAAPAYAKAALEDSLRRLQTDYVDLYQLHRPDPTTPIAATLGALAELVLEGKIREIGCSNFTAEQLREAKEATAPGAPGFASVQNEYSLLHREPELGVLEACERLGMALIPYFPLKMGLLSGKFHRGEPPPPGSRVATMPPERQSELLDEEMLSAVERLERFANARGRSLLELAIAWLLSNPTVVSVIAGATKPEQVRANAASAAWALTEAEVTEVASLAPQPKAAA